VSNVWTPWDPEGHRLPEPSGEKRGPDPEPIVRSVRIGFLLAGILVAAMVNAVNVGTHGAAVSGGSNLAVTGIVAVVVVGIVAIAGWAFRPSRLLSVGKRALNTLDQRELRPKAERARSLGFRGLAMTWAGQALVPCFLPAIAGLGLAIAHGTHWELLTFASISLLAGFLLQHQVTGAVRQAVDDPDLRARYGSR
jgi:membrane protein implicated in regulation of membrane protease activity